MTVSTDYPGAPGVPYDPSIQQPDPYVAPASYNATDQVAAKGFRGQVQQRQHDPRMTALSPLVKGLQRGFICQDPGTQGKGLDGKGLRRFSFLFNPSTLPMSYQSSGTIEDSTTVQNEPNSGGALIAVGASGGANVSLSLLLDRTYETWSNKASRGVLEDVIQLEKITGYSEANPWMRTASYVHVFMGQFHHYFGVLQSMNVTYTNWTQYLVPNRASVDLDLMIYPWAGASYDPTVTPQGHTLSPGDNAAATQTYAEQVPTGSPTGLYSPNGYAASKDPKSIQVTSHAVINTGVQLAMNDAVAPLLEFAAAQWHQHVEPLDRSQCGGYNFRRNVNNPNVLSNHSSGTAIDLNSTTHPNNTDPTANFTGPQIAFIRDHIIAPAGGCLRWGGDYHSTKDGMHIEINAPIGQVQAQIASMALETG